MTSFLVKYKNIFLGLTLLFFLGGIGFVGAGVFMEEYGPNAPIAKVGGHKIKYKDFETAYRMADRNLREKNPQDYTQENQTKLRQEVLQALINEESLVQSARAYGLGVSDLEVGYLVRALFSPAGYFDKKMYVWNVRNNYGLNPSAFEANLAKQRLAEKMQNIILLSAKVPQQELDLMFKKDAKTKDLDNDSLVTAAQKLKAQSLMDSFTEDFNAHNRIELKRNAFQPTQKAEDEF